jgi:transposase InsO family protein/transposase-like protein
MLPIHCERLGLTSHLFECYIDIHYLHNEDLYIKKLTDQEKTNIVAEYSKGKTVALLCLEHDVPRSSIYSWIKHFQPIKSPTQTNISYNDYYVQKRRADKLNERLNVIQAAGCGTSASLQEKLTALEKLYDQGQYSVHALCDALNIARGTFYNHIFRRKEVTYYDKRREEMMKYVTVVFNESKQRYGANKVHAVLSERGVRTSTKYVAKLMMDMGLRSVTIDSAGEYRKQRIIAKKQNHLNQQFNSAAPNTVWVSDVTCFKIKEHFFYICVVIDLFSRKAIAHGVSKNNSTYLVTSTVKQAFHIRNRPQNLVFHSDRGVQYVSRAFRSFLAVNKIVQSFSKSGCPHDNAVAGLFCFTEERRTV